jgi:hypothetical protein
MAFDRTLPVPAPRALAVRDAIRVPAKQQLTDSH